MELKAEWIDYMGAWRLYNPERPESTAAYVDDLNEVVLSAVENDYKRLTIEFEEKKKPRSIVEWRKIEGGYYVGEVAGCAVFKIRYTIYEWELLKRKNASEALGIFRTVKVFRTLDEAKRYAGKMAQKS